jgi:uncharacterized protein (DUF849 family)
MIQSVADEEAYATLGEVTKNVAKTIQKKSERQKQFDDIHVIYAVHLAKLSITRDKDLMDFEMGYSRKIKRKNR